MFTHTCDDGHLTVTVILPFVQIAMQTLSVTSPVIINGASNLQTTSRPVANTADTDRLVTNATRAGGVCTATSTTHQRKNNNMNENLVNMAEVNEVSVAGIIMGVTGHAKWYVL